MVKIVNFILWILYSTKIILELFPKGNHRGVKLITTQQMLLAHPAPSPPQQPRGKDRLLCSGLPASVLGDVAAPAPHGLTSASLTDPVLQALLQGSSKPRVTLFCGRLGAKFTSSQGDLCNPRMQGVSPAPDWGWRALFFRWKQKVGAGSVCEKKVCVGDGEWLDQCPDDLSLFFWLMYKPY